MLEYFIWFVRSLGAKVQKNLICILFFSEKIIFWHVFCLLSVENIQCYQKMANNKILDFEAYRNNFSDSGLWEKIKQVAKKAGIKVVYAALVLYYLAKDGDMPIKDKLKIYGALGYFILPIDMIPDSIIALGFTDDFAALAYALYSAARYVTPEIKAKAEKKLEEWFGNYDRALIAGLLPATTADDNDQV